MKTYLGKDVITRIESEYTNMKRCAVQEQLSHVFIPPLVDLILQYLPRQEKPVSTIPHERGNITAMNAYLGRIYLIINGIYLRIIDRNHPRNQHHDYPFKGVWDGGDIAITNDGVMYIVDAYFSNLHAYQAGKLDMVKSCPGRCLDTIAVCKDKIVIANTHDRNVCVYTLAWEELLTISLSFSPAYVAASRKYIAVAGETGVEIFTFEGTHVCTIAAEYARIAMSSYDEVYIIPKDERKIHVYTCTGIFLRHVSSGDIITIRGQYVYVADEKAGHINVYTIDLE